MSLWDTEWAAEKAAEALRYLGRNYHECLENLRVLDEHETAAHEAAMHGERDAYLEALRAICELVGTGPCGFVGAQREVNIYYRDALDQLLLRRFGGKVGEFSNRLEFCAALVLKLPGTS